MRSAAVDLLTSVVEAFLDLIDGFAEVKPHTYFITAGIILAVVVLATVGPAINLPTAI